MKDISKELLKLSPVQLFDWLADTYFKELDDLNTEEIDWLAWDPDSLVLFLSKKRISISDPIAIDKMMATFAFLFRRDLGTSDAKAFEKLVHAFNNDPIVVDVIQEPTLEAVNYAVTQMRKLNNALQKREDRSSLSEVVPLEFKGEVPGYVASVAFINNFPILNSNLDFATEMLDFINSNKWRDKQYDGLISKLKDLVQYLETTKLDSEGIEEILSTVKDSSEIVKNMVVKYIGLLMYDPCVIE